VCFGGEANAWPYNNRERDTAYPDELVHWAARRIATGESFEFVLAPRNPLSPRTSGHIGLDASVLCAGGTAREFLDRWRAFVRPSDVLCAWGHYAAELLVDVGGSLPPDRVDLRHVAREVMRGKVGTVEEFSVSLGTPTVPSAALGRCGERLAKVAEIA